MLIFFIFVAMLKSHKIARAIFSSTLIVIMGLFVLNNTMFYHVHILPGGKLISHAHPFSDKDSSHGTKHTHSGAEFFQLDASNLSFIWMILSIALVVPLIHKKLTRFELKTSTISSSAASAIRGPPIW